MCCSPLLLAVLAAGPNDDFFPALVEEAAATRVTGLGCGTGIPTVTLTREGPQVTGIDPALAMLSQARHKPGADEVHWIHGACDRSPSPEPATR